MIGPMDEQTKARIEPVDPPAAYVRKLARRKSPPVGRRRLSKPCSPRILFGLSFESRPPPALA